MTSLEFLHAFTHRRVAFGALALASALGAAALAGCGGSATSSLPAVAQAPLSVSSAGFDLPESVSNVAKPPSRIYIANYSTNAVNTYDLHGNQVTPSFTDGVSGPHFIAIGNKRMYVANSNYVQVLAYKLKSGTKTTPAINQNLRFSVGIAVNAKGVVYVSDFLNGTVTTYDGISGTQEALTITGLSNPLGIAVDKHNKVYVANGSAVSIFNAKGTPLTPITSGITAPQAVVVDAKGKIYVSSCPGGSGNGFVSTFTSKGTPTTPTITGLSCPEQIQVDALGTIYVGDVSTGMLTTYNAKGKQQALTINAGGSVFGIAVH